MFEADIFLFFPHMDVILTRKSLCHILYMDNGISILAAVYCMESTNLGLVRAHLCCNAWTRILSNSSCNISGVASFLWEPPADGQEE